MRASRKPLTWGLLCALGGCLPLGEPPAGRHLVHDRTLSGVFLSPSEQDGVPSYLLATGPLVDPDLGYPYVGEAVSDLYRLDARLDADAAQPVEGLAQLAPTIDDVRIPYGDPTSYTLDTDSRGRLLFVRWDRAIPPALGNPYRLWRLDPAAQRAEELAYVDVRSGVPIAAAPPRSRPQPLLVSPGRTRVLAGDSGGWQVVGLDTRQSLWHVNDAAFIGEDLYCAGIVSFPTTLTSGTDILRVRPDAAPEVLYSSTGYLGLYPVVGDFDLQLVLFLNTYQGAWPFTLVDSASLESKTLPAELGQAELVSTSPSGQLLLLRKPISPATATQAAEYRLFVFDWATGDSVVLDSASVGKGLRGGCEWRPGASELWCQTLPTGFLIWRPNNTVTLVAEELYAFAPGVGQPSYFTADGRHWFSSVAIGPRLTAKVGAADDPYAPRWPLHPPGTYAGSYWLLDDGRLLVQAWASSWERNDIYLVDADTGSSRTLGSSGRIVAVGLTRALALLDWQLSRSSGELDLIDYASGSRQVLASDVYAVAVDRGSHATAAPGTDLLAPGTRVAYLSRNRLESRDDGLWVAELP